MHEAFQIFESKIQTWLQELIENLPEFMAAFIVLAIFILLAKLVKRIIIRAFRRFGDAEILVDLVSALTYYAVIIAGIIVALGILKLDSTVNKLLAGAGIIGLGIGFAFQDIFANVFSGALIAIRRMVRVGDYIVTNDYEGIVKSLLLRNVIIQDNYGQVIAIPSKMVLQNPIKNFSTTHQRMVVIDCGIAYNSDLEKVRDISLKVANAYPKRLEDMPVQFYYQKFNDSSIDFVLRFWIMFNNKADLLEAESETILKLKQEFDKNGIEIPFPIRTIVMDAGKDEEQ